MSEFAEADARLAAIHGYEPVYHLCEADTDCVQCHENTRAATERRPAVRLHMIGPRDVLTEVLDVAARLTTLEAKVDALIHALKAGAVGKWTP